MQKKVIVFPGQKVIATDGKTHTVAFINYVQVYAFAEHAPKPIKVVADAWGGEHDQELVLIFRRPRMALVPLASEGNFLHIYDFIVDANHIDEFVALFNEFDYGDNNELPGRSLRTCKSSETPSGTSCGFVHSRNRWRLADRYVSLRSHRVD